MSAITSFLGHVACSLRTDVNVHSQAGALKVVDFSWVIMAPLVITTVDLRIMLRLFSSFGLCIVPLVTLAPTVLRVILPMATAPRQMAALLVCCALQTPS